VDAAGDDVAGGLVEVVVEEFREFELGSVRNFL
jgi:hypothetical protein